jgi:hypothetical protein
LTKGGQEKVAAEDLPQNAANVSAEQALSY